MANGSLLALLVLITAPPLALSRSRRVFPDDAQPLYWKNLVPEGNEKNGKNYTVCDTELCKKIGMEFASSMRKSVDPCDDFYEYSCGGWDPKNVIPPGRPYWSRFLLMQDTVQYRIKVALEKPVEASDILPVRQAKKWYRSCMDTAALEQRGIKPIETIVMHAGGWPIAMDEAEWDSEVHPWQKVEMDYARLTGSYVFYKFDVLSIPGTLDINPPEKTLSEQLPTKMRNYTNEEYEGYVELVEKTARLFAEHNEFQVSEEKLKKEAREIVEFEKNLFAIVGQGFSYRSFGWKNFLCWYEKNATVKDMEPRAKIHWKSVVDGLFDMIGRKIEYTKIDIIDSNYLIELGKLLEKTPERTIVNYVHWTFVGNMLVYTNEYLRNQLLDYKRREYGIKERLPRWVECVEDMKMGHAAGYVFTKKYFDKGIQETVAKTMKNIKREMELKIKNSNWLDEKGKNSALEKLSNMRLLAGFPDWYNDEKIIESYYKGLTVGSEYFENVLSYMRYSVRKMVKKFFKLETEDWDMDPITVNALYSPFGNLINLPAAIFQDPLFKPQVPEAVNYGVSGVVVGHEIGHGFDNQGIHFDVQLSEEMMKSYYQRADCFSRQYDEYYREMGIGEIEAVKTEDESARKVNMSQLTRGENIADTTGIQAVFQAYEKLKGQEKDMRLPGLEDLNGDQLFFLSFAASWCEVETALFAKRDNALLDPHSPARLRVIGSVSNTRDFARVFNCPAGSPMNPEDKCDIWKRAEGVRDDKPQSTRRKHHIWTAQWKN